jgi:hypothetical protein
MEFECGLHRINSWYLTASAKDPPIAPRLGRKSDEEHRRQRPTEVWDSYYSKGAGNQHFGVGAYGGEEAKVPLLGKRVVVYGSIEPKLNGRLGTATVRDARTNSSRIVTPLPA